MIIVPIKEGESIDRALKKYKRKFEKTGVVKLKAIYIQQMRNEQEI